MKKIAVLFVVWRVLLFSITAIAPLFLEYRQDFGYTSYSFYLSEPITGWQKAIEPWANFDGVHYLNIARRGYTDEWRFFPVLPIVINTLSVGNDRIVLPIGFLVSQLITFAALYWLYKLLRLDYSENTALKTIACLLAFPTSFFLGGVYTEGLFLLLSSIAFYAARKKEWGIAALLAAVVSATRIVGIVLIPALLIELWLQHRQQVSTFIHKQWKTIGLLCSGIGGLIAYSLYVKAHTGDPLFFLKAHTLLSNSRSIGLVNPLQTGFRYLKILASLSPSIYEWWIALLEVGVFVVAILFFFWAWRLQIRKSYWWFALFAFSVPALSGTFTGLPRYVLVLFPLFLPIALTQKKWVFAAYLLAAIPWLILFTALFSRGYFIA